MFILDKNSRKILNYLIAIDKEQDKYNIVLNVNLNCNEQQRLETVEKSIEYLLETNCIKVSKKTIAGSNMYKITNFGKHYYQNIILKIIKTIIISFIIPIMVAYLTANANCNNCSNVANQNSDNNLNNVAE